ncbi:unnamed protein product [Brassicogethes aeneus]|uniref:Cathepsin L n=1 Tax=Brassicogethes aeneus TaxID=1431903 RepID=A0A9P0AZ93_BRAAE|nr:unnamed protein product [Brassicogethes aeneus]
MSASESKRSERQADRIKARINLPFSPTGAGLIPPNVGAQINAGLFGAPYGRQTPRPNLPVAPAPGVGGQTPRPDLPVAPVPFGPSGLSFSGSFGTSGPAVTVGLDGISLEQLINEEWSTFKLTYNKTYPSQEIENFRREIFIENRGNIARFNREYGQGKRSFVQQLNPYGDQLFHEFNNNLNGYNRSLPDGRPRLPFPNGSTFIPSANVILPGNMDWRQVGAVSPVRSQGMCAGCWAFAAAGALEGHNFRKTGSLVELSPQNLIDCTEGGNNGCKGGNVNPAYDYVKNNPGIDTEPSYPYEAKDGPCRFKPETVGGVCTGYVDIAEGDEKGLEIAVATIGPVAVAISCRQTLQFYSEGVYFDPECGNQLKDLNHAVLVVGFGTEPDGKKYWLVKNSYGEKWGQGGYVKMAKDQNNHCGIASAASYPLV